MEECHSDMVSEIQRECILSEAVSIGVRDFTYSIPNSVKSRFVERFPELSLFFKAYSLLDSEMICIFPYFCPYAESAREIREIFV